MCFTTHTKAAIDHMTRSYADQIYFTQSGQVTVHKESEKKVKILFFSAKKNPVVEGLESIMA